MNAKVKKRANMHGNAVQSKIVRVHVTKEDIENAECMNPHKCMIKVAMKRALNLAHGYIHVDATGISISRNGSYREKAFMSKPIMKRMLAFDSGQEVKPFSFQVEFLRTTKIVAPERQAKLNTALAKRRLRDGHVEKKYDMRSRVIGLSVSGGAQVTA